MVTLKLKGEVECIWEDWTFTSLYAGRITCLPKRFDDGDKGSLSFSLGEVGWESDEEEWEVRRCKWLRDLSVLLSSLNDGSSSSSTSSKYSSSLSLSRRTSESSNISLFEVSRGEEVDTKEEEVEEEEEEGWP